jgi:hypothetical protein
MLRISFATAVACLLVGACVNSTPIHTADGRQGHAISCSGAGLYGTYVASWNQCFERAGEICGARGYDILSKSDETGVLGGSSYNQYGGGGSISTSKNRSMVMACKGAKS